MKTIWVVMNYDAFVGEGWEPVYACDSKKEADEWLKDKKKSDSNNEIRGMHYRIKTCKYARR